MGVNKVEFPISKIAVVSYSLCIFCSTPNTTALFDYISAGRSTHCAFYHWRPHLSSDCCIGLEQFAGVSPVIAVVASFPQQTENWTFCPVLHSWLRTSHCADYYYVTSLFKFIVTCPCSLRTECHAKVYSSFIIIIIIRFSLLILCTL